MKLHVNIDHVATVRNARGTSYPDPVRAAAVCIAAGAHGITAHLREDRRHVRDEDVARLSALVRGRQQDGIVFNLEMAATQEMLAIALGIVPDVVTLVPERRQERTTEGGLDVASTAGALRPIVAALRNAGIRVSLFVAPDEIQVDASRAVGADEVELHTGEFAHAYGHHQGHGHGHGHEFGSVAATEVRKLRGAAERAHGAGLRVAAGHGLTVDNVAAITRIPFIEELNIGHALVADALFYSLPGAVHAFLRAMRDVES
jgi:pyridoxine 5-phosphate synthase